MKRIEIPIVERKDSNSITRADTIKKVSRIADLYKRSQVSDLWYKYQNNIEFTKDDLITLYDIFNENYLLSDDEKKIIGKIRNTRIISIDMSKIFDCDPLEVAISQEVLSKDPDRYVVLWGSLIYYEDKNNYNNLKYIKGNLSSSIIGCKTIIDSFSSLISVGGVVDFNTLEDASGFVSLKSIGKYADFSKLTDANGLNNLEIIGLSAYFNSLNNIKGLDSLRYIGNFMNFDNLPREEYEKIKRRVKKK